MVACHTAPVGRPRGFAAVDLLVALVIVETALLSVLGLAVQSSRILSLAERTEVATAAVQRIADSLSASPSVAEHRLFTDWGRVEWESGSRSWIVLRALPNDSLAPPLVDARVWVP